MGHTPISVVASAPDRESFHIGRARHAYVTGRIGIDRFEALVGHVLDGGHLSQALDPKGGPGKEPPPLNPSNRSSR